MKTIEIKQIDNYGYGILEMDQRTYRIPNVLLGEKVQVDMTTKGFEVIKRLSDSPKRAAVRCPKYDTCGGCQLMHMNYADQLELKKQQIIEQCEKYQLEATVLDPIGSNEPYNYRNKIQMTFKEHKGKIVAGLYEENTHKVVNISDCDIQDKVANQIINTIKALMKKHKIPAYDEDKRTGIIRHVLVKRSLQTKQILVVIVTPSNIFPGRNNLVKDLNLAHPDITSIVHNINERKTSIVLGDESKIITGKGYIEDILMGKRFLIGPKTFYQVNAHQTEVLYGEVLKKLQPKKTDVILDAYAGIGTIGLMLSDHVSKVLSVEINKDSVRSAVKNAELNGIKNVEFVAADAKDYILALVEQKAKLDAIVVDPPRAGLDLEFVKAIQVLKPKKVVYVSCDPETLVRDLKQLSRTYMIGPIQPVDMFSQTYHIENCVLLTLKI